MEINLRKGEIIRIKILLKKGTNLARSSKIIRLDKRYNFYILFTRKTPIIILLFFFILFYFTTKCYGSTKVYAQVNTLPLQVYGGANRGKKKREREEREGRKKSERKSDPNCCDRYANNVYTRAEFDLQTVTHKEKHTSIYNEYLSFSSFFFFIF